MLGPSPPVTVIELARTSLTDRTCPRQLYVQTTRHRALQDMGEGDTPSVVFLAGTRPQVPPEVSNHQRVIGWPISSNSRRADPSSAWHRLLDLGASESSTGHFRCQLWFLLVTGNGCVYSHFLALDITSSRGHPQTPAAYPILSTTQHPMGTPAGGAHLHPNAAFTLRRLTRLYYY
ncbi:hypothetical protein FA95DRAFT_1554288 [Auriscalpium vulgare]|uniref:Uncharacterized protein n=1 Tax=Auriscalpium vulgare TaxID=40419 RepID=A0ACB8S6L7_9AGAM|nr:hypothetical protein FA95DRAFT_1554288 [Auriscalpium vulgare]